MSENYFKIEPTADTPLFVIDKDKGKVLAQGVSMPENAYEFYEPLEKKTGSIFESSVPNLEIEIELSYMNSLSNKLLLKLIKLLNVKCPALKVIWKYAKGDELMRFKGDEIKIICTQIEVEVVEVN